MSSSRTDVSWVKRRITTKFVVLNVLGMIPNNLELKTIFNGFLVGFYVR